MKVWSLTTQYDADPMMYVSLYLTEWQAYQGLAEDVLELDMDNDPLVLELRKKRLQLLYESQDFDREEWDEEVKEFGIKWDVQEHNHPWVFGPED